MPSSYYYYPNIYLISIVSHFLDFRKGTEYSNPINYSALGLEFLYRHPGYQEDYQLYLDDENPELENRILQQDFSDLPNQYDNVELEKLLNSQHALDRKYPELNDYNLPDYQSGGQVLSPYYTKQANLGNERFYPLDYRQMPERYAVVKKQRGNKLNPWSNVNLPGRMARPYFSMYGNRNRGRKIFVSKRSKEIKKEKPGIYGLQNN